MIPDDLVTLIRNACQAIGGALMAKGVISEGDVALYSGVAVSLATLAWSYWHKRLAARALAAAKSAAPMLLMLFSVVGCQSQAAFEELLRAVPKNCHTTIDAQVSAGITGLGGSGHFQQECWPEGMAPTFPSP